MIRTDKPPFGRLITAMVTPFDDQLRIDFKAVARLTEHLINTGSHGLVVAGTTGESPTLENSEKLSLLREVMRVANGRCKVIMGTGSNDTKRSVELSVQAQQAGADGLLVVAPYYNKPSQNGIMRHFEEISKSVTLPIFVYNIPGRTGINIEPATIVELAQRYENIHAVKESSGNVDAISEIAGRARDEFLVYSGDDYLTLPFLSVGACGIVSVASHFAGKQINAMMDNFFAGNLDAARKAHYDLLPLFKGLFAAPNPTCSKYALSRMGICSEHLRLPMVPLESAQRAAMDTVLKQCNIVAELSHTS